jgi:hypothetical protein
MHSRLTFLALVILAIALFIGFAATRADIVSPDNTISPVAGLASGAAQSNAASLAATSGRTNYITGFDITGGGATAASVIEVSVTGLSTAAGSTLKYEVAIAAGVTAPAFGTAATNAVYSVRYPVALPASGTNTAITVTCPSFGAGNTNASVIVYGYLK